MFQVEMEFKRFSSTKKEEISRISFARNIEKFSNMLRFKTFGCVQQNNKYASIS